VVKITEKKIWPNLENDHFFTVLAKPVPEFEVVKITVLSYTISRHFITVSDRFEKSQKNSSLLGFRA
jgi:hypothetical protein